MPDSIVKRLVIRASNTYDDKFKIVPVNTNSPIEMESEIGTFSLIVSIKNFDGSGPHLSNSLYNVGDKKYLNGETNDCKRDDSGLKSVMPNLRIEIKFKPKYPIKGSELLFGNDFTTPIREYVPTALLATGLKFFTWFIDSTVRGDIYSDQPYLYGLAVNSFTFMSVENSNTSSDCQDAGDSVGQPQTKTNSSRTSNRVENLNSNYDNSLQIPSDPLARKKFFVYSPSNAANFIFYDNSEYLLQFDTNYLKLADSTYAVNIPTFGNKSFDIDVSRYANENLNNFNWTLKHGGYDGVGYGRLGLIINFALLDEDK